MVTAQHSFTAATIAAHRDAWNTLHAMPNLAWVAVFIVTLQAGLGVVMSHVIPRNSLLGHDITGVLHYALLTPFFIAVHRFIIFGEITTSYRVNWRDQRYQLFFGWAFTLFVLSRLTTMGTALPKHWMFQFLLVAGAVVIGVVLTRLALLFPAIAVDAPGATPRNAFEDTKGHGWYIFFLFVVAFIPSLLVFLILSGVLVALQPFWGRILLLPIVEIASLLWLTMAVTMASRLYQSLGNRLNQPD